MDFRAINVVAMAVSALVNEISWSQYGEQGFHTPLVSDESDCRKLDMLLDMLGTLTRMLDTRMNYVTTEGKVVREWVEVILQLGDRYQRELKILEGMERRLKVAESSKD
jgi:hypothetical protein